MMERYDIALIDLSKSLKLDPNNTFTLRNHEIDQNDEWTLYERAESFFMLKKYNKALADLTKSLEIVPNNASALSPRSLIYVKMNKIDEALSDLTQSLRIYQFDTSTLKI
ncbi:tetratricopeptide repeat protein [Gigaspora margarita]|uniref:Tetratricopeptide repeat protein n=1 Tax=Gigaspora margarita TaxID=4874 RepID=A0A8H4EPU8_GIGMA|nr:tetratricopeptide repeat protein [Gigaspora margarita]